MLLQVSAPAHFYISYHCDISAFSSTGCQWVSKVGVISPPLYLWHCLIYLSVSVKIQSCPHFWHCLAGCTSAWWHNWRASFGLWVTDGRLVKKRLYHFRFYAYTSVVWPEACFLTVFKWICLSVYPCAANVVNTLSWKVLDTVYFYWAFNIGGFWNKDKH